MSDNNNQPVSKISAITRFLAGCGCISIFSVLALGGLAVLGLYLFKQTESYYVYDTFSEQPIYGDPSMHYKIAVIDIKGEIASAYYPYEVMTCAQTVLDQLRSLSTRDDIHALILDIDSPGGEVTASDEIYNAVIEYKREKNCPVVAYMGGMAASGGLYVACAADSIVAHRSSLTGSLGVIMSDFSYYGLMSKIGVGEMTFKSGKMKDAPSPMRPVSQEESVIFQSVVDSLFEDFLTVVSTNRNIPKHILRKSPLADGRVILGMDAPHFGLADKTGYFSDAVVLACEMAEFRDNNVYVFREVLEPSIYRMLTEGLSSKTNLQLHLPGASPRAKLQPGKMYYILPQAAL